MRASACIVLLLAGCGPATPPVAAPQVAPAPAAVDVEAASKLDGGTPSPASPPPAAAGEPVLNKLTVPGERAPNLAIGKAEQAAIDAACKKLCTVPSCRCDAIRPLPEQMLLRQFDPSQTPERGYGWYVLQRTADGAWFTVVDLEYAPGGDDISRPHEACGVRGPDPLPEGLGLFGVRLPDLNLDGRPDLLFECRSEWRHDVHYCLSDGASCTTLLMRVTLEGELRQDVDFEFRNGWFIPTVRVDQWKESKANIRVDGVRTPDPAPRR